MRSEFDFIQNIKTKYGLAHVGDDCAVLPKDNKTDMVLTADMLVEDIDFRLDWTTPDAIAHKALAVSLSDIAAMGAEPKWSILSIGVPEGIWNSRFLDDFYVGWHHLAAKFDVELVGGDISRTADKVVIDSVVGGEVPRGKAIFRSTAKAGDAIIVTGTLGAAAGGLELLRKGAIYNASSYGSEFVLLDRQLCPSARIDRGQEIQRIGGVSAMIDISDGLSSDLYHICVASSVGATVFAEKLPVEPNLSILSLSREKELDMALNGGEDFELLFTVAQNKISQFPPPNFTVIGEITANVGIIELVCNAETSILEPKGYHHF